MPRITKKDFKKYDYDFSCLTDNVDYLSTQDLKGDYGDWHGTLVFDFSNMLESLEFLHDVKLYNMEHSVTYSAKTFDDLCDKVWATIKFFDMATERIDCVIKGIDNKFEQLKQDYEDDTDMLNKKIDELEKELEIARAVMDGLNSRPGRKM